MKKSVLTVFAIAIFLFSTVSFAQVKYDHELKDKDFTFNWKVDGGDLHVKLSAKCKGWIGIGFNPEKEMKGANFIIGYVKDGTVKIGDHYGDKLQNHKSDKKLGGTKDLKNKSGKEENGITEISFTIPLDSKDKMDKKIDPNADTVVYLAYADMDSMRAKHKYNKKFKVNLSTGKWSK